MTDGLGGPRSAAPRLGGVMNTPPHDAVPPPEGPSEPTTGAARLRPPLRRVSGRSIGVWTVRSILGGLVNLVLLSVLAWAAGVLPWSWIPGWARENAWMLPTVYFVYALLRTAIVPSWRYRVHRWEVTDTAVYTQTGWWSIEQRIAPMSRIQTVDYHEGAISRLFRLASVTVTTASAAGALVIEGLDRDLARSLVQQLTQRADAVPGDAT